MLTLLIDTSTLDGVVAILKREIESNLDEIVMQKQLPHGYHQHSKYLMPTIEAMLKECQICVKNLSLIVVGTGPGSYTGMRVSAVVGKTLSYCSKIPVVGISTLKGFVCKEESASFVSVLDARMGGVYYMLGCKLNGVVKEQTDPKKCTIEEAKNIFNDIDVIVSPDWQKLQERLADSNLHCLWEKGQLNVTHMSSLGWNLFQKSEKQRDYALPLHYLA